MSKLTLSVDDDVVSRAKLYARQRGVSISKMVEAYLDTLATPAAKFSANTPILNRLRGSLRRGDCDDYRKHLAVKYR